ncbi:DUF4148 domain-containing protein [Paraburkholderia sp.]|uniref:DUF4148 domain-containing protein n=1 Tax=Paraburkholderia sp. TaxID=1926495 RepID=UPI003C75B730
MKTLIGLGLVVSALVTPALSFAQASNQPVTRAEVRADLVRVEQAGYSPSNGEDATYPAQIQAAEAKVAEQEGAQMPNASATPGVETTAVGAMTSGSSASGTRQPMTGKTKDAACVGPVSFCTPFFGG